MSGQYILIKQKPVRCLDLLGWGRWMGEGPRHVGDVTKKGVRVSTVFLGLDHNYGLGEPILWETMIFGNNVGDIMCRYRTMNQAREGHRQAVKLVRRMTKCPIKKKYRKNLSNRTTATLAIIANNALPSSLQDHNHTIPTCVAPAISEHLKPSNPTIGKSAK